MAPMVALIYRADDSKAKLDAFVAMDHHDRPAQRAAASCNV
jgi:hypothetical protein